jgi:hypothetical protein
VVSDVWKHITKNKISSVETRRTDPDVEEVTEMLRNDHQLTVKKIEKN